MKKEPIKLANIFKAEIEQVELPDGRIADVRPIDGIGFDLYSTMEENPSRANLLWEIAARCLPSLELTDVKKLTAAECTAVITIAVGKVSEVQRLAEEMAGNARAPKTAEPAQSSMSQTPSDSSASASRGISGGV